MNLRETFFDFLIRNRYYLLVLLGVLTGSLYINYFCTGTVLGGLSGSATVLNNLSGLSELSGISINGTILWKYIFIKRMRDVFILFLLCCTAFAIPSVCIYTLYAGICMGVVLCEAVAGIGLKGILIYVVMFIPHYIMYIAAVLLIVKFIPYGRTNIKKTAAIFCIVIITAFIGTILEAFINPPIMKFILNNFCYII